jgi:hypothetical protein
MERTLRSLSGSRTATLASAFLGISSLGAFALVAAGCGDDRGSGTPDAGATGVSVCGLTGGAEAPPCAPAAVRLSEEICRCGSRYYWNGTECVGTAACECFSGCDLLYETPELCMAKYARCGATP